MNSEIWKDILDYEGDYQVSNLGRVKSFIKWNGTNERILKQYKRGDYFYVRLCKNKEIKNKNIHTLVFEAHNNYKIKDDECVHHIDEEPENNYYENLEKMPKFDHKSFHHKGKSLSETHKKKLSENHSDTRGENNPAHKLTEEQVIQIKLLLKEGKLTQQKIADMFGVNRTLISMIKNGKRWAYVAI